MQIRTRMCASLDGYVATKLATEAAHALPAGVVELVYAVTDEVRA